MHASLSTAATPLIRVVGGVGAGSIVQEEKELEPWWRVLESSFPPPPFGGLRPNFPLLGFRSKFPPRKIATRVELKA